MNLKPQEKKTLLKTALYGIAGLGLYYLYKEKSVTEAAKKAVETPAKVAKVAAKHSKEFIKDVIDADVKVVKKTVKKKTKKSLDKNKDRKVDATELAKAKIPPTDQNIIDANNLKGKAAAAVKSGKTTKNKGVSKEEFKRRMAAGREKAKLSNL